MLIAGKEALVTEFSHCLIEALESGVCPFGESSGLAIPNACSVGSNIVYFPAVLLRDIRGSENDENVFYAVNRLHKNGAPWKMTMLLLGGASKQGEVYGTTRWQSDVDAIVTLAPGVDAILTRWELRHGKSFNATLIRTQDALRLKMIEKRFI